MKSEKPQTPAEYFSRLGGPAKKHGLAMRALIRSAAPSAEEVLSYSMPLYKLNGRLVYFTTHKAHLGFYPFKSAIRHFAKELEGYETAPGTVRFPYDRPLPAALIRKMVKFRIKENAEKLAAKKSPRSVAKKNRE